MIGNSHSLQVAGPSVPLSDAVRDGLALLWQAYRYAEDAGVDLWDFALEVDKLYDAGLTINDLRWLIAKGFAGHGQETSAYGDAHRSFRPGNGYNFHHMTCLVLMPNGVELANHVLNGTAVSRPLTLSIDSASNEGAVTAASQSDSSAVNNADEPQSALKPHWNSQRRELWLADTIVKRFRVPARNQQAILCAFEEEAWPDHIDDPLPVSGNVDPHTRLHDAIYRLNHHQTNYLIRFHGNGCSDGVLWERR